MYSNLVVALYDDPAERNPKVMLVVRDRQKVMGLYYVITKRCGFISLR